MAVYRIDLAYDGSGFRGYAAQPGQRTVQRELDDALGRILGPTETVVAGRTDTGVHATGQVVSFTADENLDVDRLARSLLGMLAPEIAVHGVRRVPDDFHARFSAVSRSYRYRVLNAPVPDPLRRHVTWHVADPLDLAAMNAAAAGFVGTHDFASLCRKAANRSSERTVAAARWSAQGDERHFDVTASSFCHQLVRSMVALTVAVGRARLAPDAVAGILEARDRNASRGAAPPSGLTLAAVTYPESGG